MNLRWYQVAAVLVALSFLVCASGWLLPRQWSVEQSAVVAAAPDRVFEYVNTYEGWRAWGRWAQEVDPSLEFSDPLGPSEGEGMAFEWHTGGEQAGVLRLVESEPGERVRYLMESPTGTPVMHGEIRLEPVSAGVVVHWREGGDLGWNPLSRWLARLSQPMMEEDFAKGLEALKAEAEGNGSG